jgi:metal-sulfur cluster biosynthetic enzyme
MSDQPSTNRVIWQSEKDYPELSDTLREKLREVRDPEINMDVIQLGLIRDVKIEPENAEIKMILTTMFCPYGPQLIEMVNQKARQVLDRSTTVQLDIAPWDMSMMEDGGTDNWGLF